MSRTTQTINQDNLKHLGLLSGDRVVIESQSVFTGNGLYLMGNNKVAELNSPPGKSLFGKAISGKVTGIFRQY